MYVCVLQQCQTLMTVRSTTGGAAPCVWRGRRTAAASERGALTIASLGLTWEWVRCTQQHPKQGCFLPARHHWQIRFYWSIAQNYYHPSPGGWLGLYQGFKSFPDSFWVKHFSPKLKFKEVLTKLRLFALTHHYFFSHMLLSASLKSLLTNITETVSRPITEV